MSHTSDGPSVGLSSSVSILVPTFSVSIEILIIDFGRQTIKHVYIVPLRRSHVDNKNIFWCRAIFNMV